MKRLRLLTDLTLAVTILCSLLTSLHLLRDKRLFSDEYVYAFIAVGQFPGEAPTEDRVHPSHQGFWSHSGIFPKIRAANHLESSNMFLYELLVGSLIWMCRSTNTLLIGLASLVPIWVAAFCLHRAVLRLCGDARCALAAVALFLAHPQVFYRAVDFRGYALALMFTQVVFCLTLTTITARHTTLWRDVAFTLAASGAFFSSYNTAPSVAVCWVASFLAAPRARIRLVVGLLVLCAVVGMWMNAGALDSITARTQRLAAAIQQDPTWLGLTPLNLALGLSYLAKNVAGLVLFEGMQYRYQVFTVALGVACVFAWLRLFPRQGPQRPVDLLTVAYVGVPFVTAVIATAITGSIVPLSTSYQLWSIPAAIAMFLQLLWKLSNERLRLAVVLTVCGSYAFTIGAYNQTKRPNPYIEIFTQREIAQITVPRYYHAQMLFFHAGPNTPAWPTVTVEAACSACIGHRVGPTVGRGADAIDRLAEEVGHSYAHRRSLELRLSDGRSVRVEEPLLWERAY